MAHNRKYVPGAIDLIMGRVLNDRLMDQDNIEKLLIDSHFLDNAPFRWVGLMYRYGLKKKLIPEYQGISKKYGDLSVAIELKMEILEWADWHNLNLLYDIFMIGALEALIHVGRKYKLPIDLLESEREKYGQIPNSIEECKLYPQLSGPELRAKTGMDIVINRCSACGHMKVTPKARQCLECGVLSDPVLE